MSDLLHQNFLCSQSKQQPTPSRITGAASITPITKMSFVDAQVSLETIVPPVSGYHSLVLVFTDAAPGAFVTTGNLITAYQPVQNRPVTLHYDPVTEKYYVETVT